MAEAADITDLRARINDIAQPQMWTDAELGAVIDAGDGLDTNARYFWSLKAARYADLADIQEGSSRRALGDLHEQALKMVAYWGSVADEDTGGGAGMRPARTRPIERP